MNIETGVKKQKNKLFQFSVFPLHFGAPLLSHSYVLLVKLVFDNVAPTPSLKIQSEADM